MSKVGSESVAGVDEAGRGPLAGPVVAAAVVLDAAAAPIAGLRDSKRLSPGQRQRLAGQIRQRALSWALGWASAAEIDRHNILAASLLAMARAIEALDPAPGRAIVDGRDVPEVAMPVLALIGGDDLEPAISAASILAKTARDQHMARLHHRYPDYGFDRHKGYPTRAHLAALQRHGPCPEHRRSFAPVRRRLGAGC